MSKATFLIGDESRNWNPRLSNSLILVPPTVFHCLTDEEEFGLYFTSNREQVKSPEQGSDTV